MMVLSKRGLAAPRAWSRPKRSDSELANPLQVISDWLLAGGSGAIRVALRPLGIGAFGDAHAFQKRAEGTS